MTKALTYEEFQQLAKENYCKGGDIVVECWEKSDFDEYVEECGSVTEELALALFRLYDTMYSDIQGTIW